MMDVNRKALEDQTDEELDATIRRRERDAQNAQAALRRAKDEKIRRLEAKVLR